MYIKVIYTNYESEDFNQFAVHTNEWNEQVLLVPLKDGRFKIASQEKNDCYYKVIRFDIINNIEIYW
jgi:hypothetical protein